MSTDPARNLAADFYRVSGVLLIVLGHWLAAAVTYRDGYFGRQNPLLDQPWTQWLTLLFQAVPTFFLVAGYAAAVSWSRRRAKQEMSRQTWVRHRLARVLGPSAAYVAAVSAAVVASGAAGAAGATLEYAGWAVAMQLWFLAVYLIVAVLTPAAIAAQKRWGLRIPAALALGVIAVDIAALAGRVPYLNWLNYLLCWGCLYQLGIAWQSGSLGGRRPSMLAVGSVGALWLLIWLGPYPVSMIGVPGQAVQNTEPPSIAMLAFGCAQAGLAIAVAPVVGRVLRPAAIQRALSQANANVMTLYLWHMIPVVIVAITAYPAGLLPQPAEGGVTWWLARLEWVAILGAVTAIELALLRWGWRYFAAPLPGVIVPAGRWAEPVMAAGALMASCGLALLAVEGFAPHGRFSWLTVAIFAAGALLATLRLRSHAPIEAIPLQQ